ncbi:MAG: hypothetical protein GC154_06475 [bacterium]|nr:hypothetical protein [bacterium]
MNRARYVILWIALALGAVAALFRWEWAKAEALAFVMLAAGNGWIPPRWMRMTLAAAAGLSLWLAASAFTSVWGLVWTLGAVAAVAAAGLIAAAVSESARPFERAPAYSVLCLFGAGLFGLALALHAGVNHLLDKPFAIVWWGPAAIASAALPLGFWLAGGDGLDRLRGKNARVALAMLAVTMMAAHGVRAWMLFEYDGDPRDAAEQAFAAGYAPLGCEETARAVREMLDAGRWSEAVGYTRMQWRHLDKTRFIKAMRDEYEEQPPLFFMTICYGAQIQLVSGEAALDFCVQPESQSLYILTDRRVLLMKGESLTERIKADAPFSALSVNSEGVAAVLNETPEVEIHAPGEAVERFGPATASRYADLALNRAGDRVYLLRGDAEVEEYIREAGGRWRFLRPLYPALWKQDDAAMAMLMDEETMGCTILASNGGVYYHDPSVFKRELSPFWDPKRPVMQDLALDPASNQLLLMDRFGRVDFIDLNYAPTPEHPVKAGWPSYQAEIRYDVNASEWRGAPDKSAVAVVEGASAALQLSRNGFIQAIVMPQGARVRYRRGELKIGVSGSAGEPVVEQPAAPAENEKNE